jgi:hypothetical protein
LAKIEAVSGKLFREVADGVRVSIQVTPGSRAERISGPLRGEDGATVLRVAVTARAKENEANEALLRLLAKTWRVPKSSVSIASGQRNRSKVVHIAGEPHELAIRLNGWARRSHD